MIVEPLDEGNPVAMPFAAGSFSMHHGLCPHRSGPNTALRHAVLEQSHDTLASTGWRAVEIVLRRNAFVRLATTASSATASEVRTGGLFPGGAA